MTISQKEVYLLENPHIIQTLAAPGFGDPTRLGIRKVDDGFNDILKHVKKSHLHSKVNTKN